jgi:hypothetical protein
VRSTAVYPPYGGAGESPDKPAPGHPSKDVVMAEADPADSAADQCGSDVSNDGFDFG